MLRMKRKESGGVVIVELTGNLMGPIGSGSFHDFIKRQLGEDHNKVVINLRNVKWANSLGIGMLIGALTSVKNAGGELALTHVTDRIQSVFITTQLNRIFTTFDNDADAIGFLAGNEEQVMGGA